jgi:hypothetical protein
LTKVGERTYNASRYVREKTEVREDLTALKPTAIVDVQKVELHN